MFETLLTNSNKCCIFSLEQMFFTKYSRRDLSKSGFWDCLDAILSPRQTGGTTMQTIYYTTTNFIRHTDNVVDLSEYRRKMALAQEGSLAPRRAPVAEPVGLEQCPRALSCPLQASFSLP